MTVCVAVIANQDRIICVNDRMLTILGMEYEPLMSKMFGVAKTVGIMYAGDGGFAAEVIARAGTALEREPLISQHVERAVHHYKHAYRVALHDHLAAGPLAPLGVSITDVRSGTLAPEVRRDALQRIRRYAPPYLQALIVGIHHGTPEIYVAENGDVQVASVPGFAAIGGGRDHAYTRLMRGGCYPAMPRGDALLLAWAAKREADAIVGGVGTATDVFEIEGGAAGFYPWETRALAALDRAYTRWRNADANAYRTAVETVRREFPMPRTKVHPTTAPVRRARSKRGR